MTIPASRIFDIAAACLQAVVDHYATEGADLPARQYVANGLPAFDMTEGGECDEQVTVFVESTYGIGGDPIIEDPRHQFPDLSHAMRAGVFAVTIVRCVPMIDDSSGNPVIPSPEEETESAALIYEDAVLMLNALVEAERAGELPGCGSVSFMRWTNENAQGGVGGGTLRVAISLSDAF